MRGTRIIDSVFNDASYQVENKIKRKVCRDPELINKRNEALLHRYYFWALKNIRYEQVLKILSNEFYLSNITITKILSAQIDRLLQIKKQKPAIHDLKKLYPYLNWGL